MSCLFVKEVKVKNGKPITYTYFKKNLSKLKEKSYAKEFWAVMSEVSERRRVHALFCFTIVCPRNLPVCVVWILEVSLIKKLVSFLTIISSTVERIIVECLRNHGI